MMTSIHDIYSDVGVQSLSERDFLGITSYHLYPDETLTGVDKTWLDVEADTKQIKVGDLFPDLLDIEQDDDMSFPWLEDADVKQLLEQTNEADTRGTQGTTTTILPPQNDVFAADLLIDQLTPPESPGAQLTPEIYFIQKDIDTIMATPLSPVDISLVLDAPTLESIQPITTAQLPNDTRIISTLDQKEQDQLINHMIQEMDSLNATTSTSVTKDNIAMPANTNFIDVLSPESDIKDADYKPGGNAKRKSKRQKRNKKAVGPYGEGCGLNSSPRDVDVLTLKMNKAQRKKLQNKNAATKYRVKKRGERYELLDEEATLQRRNTELNDRVSQLTREIGYMKDLMGEIAKARRSSSAGT